MKTSKTMAKKNKTALAVSVLIVLGVGSYQIQEPVAAPAPQAASVATPVTVEEVVEKPVIEWSDFSGRIEAIEHVKIRPRVNGTIDVVHFQEGQVVNKGAPLFTIDPRPYQAVLAKAEATRESAKARLALAKIELARSSKLIVERAISQREKDQSASELLKAQAALSAAQADVLSAQLNVQYTTITAPVTGRVSRAELTVGNLVGTGQDAPVLTTVVSVSPVYVNFELDEASYIRFARNGAKGSTGVNSLPVLMGLSNETDYPYSGRIKSLDNQLDRQSGTLRVRAVFDNTNGDLTPGMYARVRTGDSAPRPATLIRDQAVGTDQSKKYVFVVTSENKVTYREVSLGPVIDGWRVVRSGLSKGERIVVEGLQKIRPNDLVDPQPAANAVAISAENQPGRS
ncbi:efflux RND transporter periplasmic adaptor subunit [Pseudomonas sp. Irchel 3A7]|uniref:efflux RND transporter periplasmic adaptor subunit n=1 Tax=Pseudomonas sp. Irchel 3A7 TaxID=2008913 RepID=UPI000BA32B75|nr:efflux RND transporter periplasmic adaptor subunit [Pseudomonas sp. Irchel 3A7]